MPLVLVVIVDMVSYVCIQWISVLVVSDEVTPYIGSHCIIPYSSGKLALYIGGQGQSAPLC